MGDHRASVKIYFSMHGHEDNCDMWLNYHPVEGCEYQIDRRVMKWLSDAYEKAMDNWLDAEADQETRRAAETENNERVILAELKAKYE